MLATATCFNALAFPERDPAQLVEDWNVRRAIGSTTDEKRTATFHSFEFVILSSSGLRISSFRLMTLSPNDASPASSLRSLLCAPRTISGSAISKGCASSLIWARRLGFRLVQLLPINETGGDNSPYNAISARAIEPTTLHLAPGSPEDLSEEAFAEVHGRDGPGEDSAAATCVTTSSSR
jgi:hypothetical protein